MGTERYRSHGPVRLGWLDVPLEDSRTAYVPISKSSARHRSAGNSANLKPVAAMRQTIVGRFVDMLQQLREAVAGVRSRRRNTPGL